VKRIDNTLVRFTHPGHCYNAQEFQNQQVPNPELVSVVGMTPNEMAIFRIF